METKSVIGTQNKKGQVYTEPRAMMNEAPRTDAGPGAGDPAGGAPGTRAGPAAGKRAEAAEHPLVKAVMETFSGATIDKVSARSDAEPPADEDT